MRPRDVPVQKRPDMMGELLALLLAQAFLATIMATPLPVKREVRADGYKPAESPREALEYFRDCARRHDYNTAAKYCGGEYGKEIRRSAESAAKLANAVGQLGRTLKVCSIDSANGQVILSALEPFPSDFRILEIVPSSSSKAVARVKLATPGEEGAAKVMAEIAKWKFDKRIYAALTPPQGNGEAEIRRDGGFGNCILGSV